MAEDSRAVGSPLVVALGGNAISDDGDGASVIDRTAAGVADATAAGRTVALTHGNGPQVGRLLRQQERTPDVPGRPLDVLVARTQADIGYRLQRALDDHLAGGTDAVTVVTQVVVDADDPAFENPTKPVGPRYTAAEAADRPFPTREVADGDRGYRRVVPSPEPQAVVEREEVAQLLAEGTHVVCAGGGGVPVVRDGGLRGVEAVVDKDLTSQVL
ncbi:MAG: carbamate kinase, partial [Halorientalis sp.]